MECPFCKYDNPAGATHCGLCYEVFSRSAAETYQRILQREKMQRQRAETMPSNALSALAQAHWKKPFTAAANFSLSHPWIIGASALVLLLAAALDFLAAPSVRLSLYGARPDYDFSSKKAVEYLVGFHTAYKSWSEINGRLDTPLEEKQLDELGRLAVQKSAVDGSKIRFWSLEWIQQSKEAEGPFAGRTVPASDPSLAATTVTLDTRGYVVGRDGTLTPRVAKSALFIMPAFPKGTLRRGHHWTQSTKWAETIGEFRFMWSGELAWTLVERVRRGGLLCDHYAYQGQLHPSVRGAPEWCAAGARHMRYTGQSHGDLYFDVDNDRIFSNEFTYGGDFIFPLTDVELVPDELRVGRLVHGAGALVLQLQNTINVSSPSTH